jgi:hypothetical protein
MNQARYLPEGFLDPELRDSESEDLERAVNCEKNSKGKEESPM